MLPSSLAPRCGGGSTRRLLAAQALEPGGGLGGAKDPGALVPPLGLDRIAQLEFLNERYPQEPGRRLVDYLKAMGYDIG